ncbi:MAG: hypothetical protein AABW73_01400 [Nanoarchaeota archaeon]
MSKSEIAKYAIINALSTALYVIILVSLIFYFGKTLQGSEETILIPIGMIMLFLFSASLTGTLVLGRPIMWYLDNKKKEALQLLLSTLIIILMITLIVFIMMITVALY